MIERLERTIWGVESILVAVAVACLAATAALVTADVVLRYLVRSPFSWLHDVVSLYLVSVGFALMLSRTFAVGAHLGVDLVAARMPLGVRRAFVLITDALSVPLFALIAWVMFHRAVGDFAAGSVMSGAIPWPTWPPAALLSLGCLLLVARLLLDCAKAVTGTLEFPSSEEAGS